MQIKNIKFQKFISTILIVAILLPAFSGFLAPKKAEAQFHDVITGIWTGLTSVFTAATKFEAKIQSASVIKKAAAEITRQLVMVAVRRALQQLTKSTINYINTGHFGNPLFIENPGSFFKDIAKTEIKTFIELTGYDSVRLPFGRQYILGTIDAYKRQFKSNAEYTLSSAIQDPIYLNKFQNDFSFGGWNGFIVNTQYPQNNFVGYSMIATQQLANKLVNTGTNTATTIQNKVQQGLGFLAPQSCPSNPNYPLATNPYNKPSFKPPVFQEPELLDPQYFETNGDYSKQDKDIYEQATNEYNTLVAQKLAEFNQKYECKGGFVDTTPGYVVASQITNALGTTFRQSELGAALGVSLSAVFDALISKWMNKGLTSLTSRINQQPVSDDFSYYGNTLGSSVTGGNNYSWDTGPDEEISVDAFKKQLRGKTIVLDDTGAVLREDVGNTGVGEYIPGDIFNTTLELKIMDNESSTEPGITQLIAQIWPRVRDLDICLPGPDLGWEDRMIAEQDRNSQKIQEKSNDNDGEKAATAQLVYKSLQFAVGYFKDWTKMKIISSLPNAIIYEDAVKAIESLYQENTELVNKKRARNQALARIKAIDSGLNAFTTQPLSGTQKEKDLITLRKQYNATKDDVSNSGRVEDVRNQLAVNKDKLANLLKLITECRSARTTAGWANPGGIGSRFTPPTTNTTTTNTNFTPTVPTNTYVPTGIDYIGYLGRTYNNGWWPTLSPDGRYVAFGNWGDSYVLDLESTANPKQMWNFKNPPGLPSGSRCMAGQWLSNTKMTFVCEITTDSFWRYEVTVGQWTAVKTNDDPANVLASIWKAEDGHFASYVPGQFRIAKDNKVIATNTGGALAISNDTTVFACTNENQEICVMEGDILTQTYPALTPLQQMTVKNGYILYGGYGPVHGISPNGNDVDLTVTGWNLEFVGDLVSVNNVMWVVTATEVNNKSYILLRPWGNAEAIVVEAPSVWTSVVYKNGNFLIAYNDDQGSIKILTVPANSPLQDLGGSPGSSSPFTTPGTELELFCTRPIVGGYPHESFRKPISSGGLFGGGIAGGVIGGVIGGAGGSYNASYKDLPLVNAADVLNWRSFWGTVGSVLCLGFCGSGVRRVNIELNCNIIFKTNVIDYKKDLPGRTISEPFVDLDAGAGPISSCETCAEFGQPDLYQNEVKAAARQALIQLELQFPGIGSLPSYDAASGGSDAGGIVGVSRLRDKTIQILILQGFNAEKVSSPDSYGGEFFYPQLVGIWRSGDTDKHGYRITAGGGTIKEAIEAGICGQHRTFSNQDVPPAPGSICSIPDDGTAPQPPADAGTKHGNQTALVAQAKSALAALGRTWVIDQPTVAEYECKRFEITNAAAKLIPGAGLLEKSGGTNCQGYSVDIIAFSDGYIYDVLGGGSADGANPMWSAVGCVGSGSNGTCPERYRQPITYP